MKMKGLEGKKGFFIIPHFDNYAINKKGNVWNITSEKMLEGNVNPAGYFNYRLTVNGKAKTMGRHVLKLLTFEYIENYENYIGDHKNNVKGDDRLSNLQWLTQQENVEKAGRDGVNKNCKQVIIEETETKNKTTYNSIAHASRETGLGVDAITYRIGLNKTFTDGKKYYFKDK